MDSTALPSDVLAETLWERFRGTGTEPSKLKAIVVGIGPGSFTGIRVGLATAKGLALGANVPVYGISSLAVWALSCGEGLRAVVLDARQGEVYSALYRVSADFGLETLIEDGTRSPVSFLEEVKNVTASGEPVEIKVLGDVADPELFASSEQWLFRLAAEVVPRVGFSLLALRDRLVEGEADDVSVLSPQYMRLTAAERNLKGL